MSDRGPGGRFAPGNQARRRRQRVLTPFQLAQLVDRKLAELDSENRTLEDFIAELVCRLIEHAHKGDDDAARWLVDRFSPPERKPRASIGRLPKPSEQPLAFLDKIAAAVSAGKVSVDDASRLARLVSPFIQDAELTRMQAELAELRRRIGDPRGSGAAPELYRVK